MSEKVTGRIPVLECLRAGRRTARRLFLLDRAKGLEDIEDAASGLPVEFRPRRDLDNIAGSQQHQGVILEADPLPVQKAEEWLKGDFSESSIVVVLDGIEDPHNFGAIVRSAVAAGVEGIVFGKDRAAPISTVAVKSAAGAMEYAPLVRGANIVRCLNGLKEIGFWTATLAEDGAEDLWQSNLKGKIALVIGSEGSGVRPLVRKSCDLSIAINLPGAIKTLNASASAAIVLAECLRQRAERAK